MVVDSVPSQPAPLCANTVVTVTQGVSSPRKWEGIGAGSLPPGARDPRGTKCGWSHAGDWRGLVHSVDTDVVHVPEGTGGRAGPRLCSKAMARGHSAFRRPGGSTLVLSRGSLGPRKRAAVSGDTFGLGTWGCHSLYLVGREHVLV